VRVQSVVQRYPDWPPFFRRRFLLLHQSFEVSCAVYRFTLIKAEVAQETRACDVIYEEEKEKRPYSGLKKSGLAFWMGFVVTTLPPFFPSHLNDFQFAVAVPEPLFVRVKHVSDGRHIDAMPFFHVLGCRLINVRQLDG
jgi:hypothetical protein